MLHFYDTVADQNGKPLAQAIVGVYTDATYTTLATIYTDDGVTPGPNPLTADSLGRFDFYTADNRYSFQISKTGYTTQRLSDHEIADVGESTPSADEPWSFAKLIIPSSTPSPGQFVTAATVAGTTATLAWGGSNIVSRGGTVPSPQTGNYAVW